MDFAIEPNHKLPVAVMTGVIKGGDTSKVCFVNFGDVPVQLQRNAWLGTGVEVDEVFLDNEEEETEEPHQVQPGTSPVDQKDVRTVQVGPVEAQDTCQTGCNLSPGSSSEEVLQGAWGETGVTHEMSTEPVLYDGGTGPCPSPESSMNEDIVHQVSLSEDSAALEGSPGPVLGDGGTGPRPSPEPSTDMDEGQQKIVPDSWITAAEGLPQHVQKLYIDTLPYLDNGDQARRLREVLIEYADVLAKHDLGIGHFSELVHCIKTGQANSIKQHMRRTPLGFENVEQKTLKSMKDAGVIEPSNSDWASPPVLVRKKDNSWRNCIDFRALNAVTVKDAYPLPRIDDCIDGLAGKELFCTLDMNSGYWQIPIAPEDRHKTAFITRYGLYQFLRMPFGTSNAPATFQRCINSVLAGLIWNTVIVYLDDVNVTGRDFEDMLHSLKVVLGRFRKYGLKLKPSKCKLFRTEVHFLGRMADKHGVRMTKEHIQAVLDWPVPANWKELERFMGFINYHRNYLKALAGKTALLFALLGVRKKWNWTEQHTEAFLALRKAMTEAPVLAYPNATDLFIVDTDASDFAIGAELSQRQEGEEHFIAYASKSLCSKQRAYCTTRKELPALVVFVQHFRHYLLGRRFVVRTDHASLVWLMRFKNPGGQICRWLEALSDYDFIIQHRRGDRHSNADGLSRIPERQTCDCYVAGQELDTLPCGGCSYCNRAHKQWQRFEEDVDDVVPLSLKQLPGGSREAAEVRTVEVERDTAESTEGRSAPRTSESGSSSQLHQTQVDGSRDDRPSTTRGESNFMAQVTQQELRDFQLKDLDIRPVLSWLEAGGVSKEAELQMQSASTRHYWVHRAQLRMKGGVLYYLWNTGTQTILLLVVPKELKTSVLEQVHDTITAGHLGRDKTLQKLRLRCYWYGMATDVRLHVATCAPCNQSKVFHRKPRAPMTIYQAGLPGDRLHLDMFGPFCESESGNRYVLMVVDQFTRWLELVPLPAQDAESVARAFFENYAVWSTIDSAHWPGDEFRNRSVCSFLWPSGSSKNADNSLSTQCKWSSGAI